MITRNGIGKLDYIKMTLDDIKIRTNLAPGDLGYVAYLHGRLYAEECNYGIKFEKYVMEGLTELAAGYNPEKDRVWVCEHDDRMVGFLSGVYKDEGLQLRYFLIAPESRGMGLGKKLMKLFTAFMEEKQYDQAFLWTTHEQEQAHKIYKYFGFSLKEEKPSEAFGKFLYEQRYVLDYR